MIEEPRKKGVGSHLNKVKPQEAQNHTVYYYIQMPLKTPWHDCQKCYPKNAMLLNHYPQQLIQKGYENPRIVHEHTSVTAAAPITSHNWGTAYSWPPATSLCLCQTSLGQLPSFALSYHFLAGKVSLARLCRRCQRANRVRRAFELCNFPLEQD